MKLSETCRVLYQNKFEKLVHLVGFYYKNLRMLINCSLDRGTWRMFCLISLRFVFRLCDGVGSTNCRISEVRKCRRFLFTTCIFVLLSFCLALTNHDSLLAWPIIYPFTTVSPIIIISTDGVKRLGILSVLFLGLTYVK